MALLILMPNRNTSDLASRLCILDSNIDLRVWPDEGEISEIEFIVTWNHPAGILGKYPNLKAIQSFGAGVDHILKDTDLPAGIPISRIVDKKLVRDLAEYVVAVILQQKRHLATYRDQQRKKTWQPIDMRQGKSVGIMGLGQIGSTIARRFVAMDFDVSGWDLLPKGISSVTCFASGQLDRFLSGADYIVCCLPLTPATTGILNAETFGQMKPEAYVINVGRGAQLIESDLLDAINSGHLSGACLDVFQTEPLPETSPLWDHPQITITPHIAGITDPDAVAGQIYDNYRRTIQGEELLHRINITLGF